MSRFQTSSNSRKYPPLAPKPFKRPLENRIAPRTKAKLDHVSAACNSCRKQKGKCSGERPRCSRCVKRNLECLYTTKPGETVAQARNRGHQEVQSRARAHQEILELLMNLPNQDAQDVLQRIRAGADIATIVSHVKTGDLLLQMAVSPETRFRYEFPYMSRMPEDILTDNFYLDSMIYEASSLYPPERSSERSRYPADTNSKSLSSSGAYQDFYVKPFHAADVIDPQLSDMHLSSWTSVCDNNALMRDLLGVWLRCEYSFTSALQKDLFLEDMASQHDDFCSPLLVNIVLGYACVCYPRFSNRAKYWDPHSLMYCFIAEAKRLWELEAHKPRITTIQAAILFNVFYNLCGLDEVGQAYRIQAIDLANKMRIFDVHVDGLSKRLQHGRAFTAWALFNWETLVGFSFMFAPLISKPPDWQLPDPLEEPDWFGEIWVKYPSSQHILPSYFGQVFRARSQFRVIMNQACQAAYAPGSETTFDKANELLLQLKRWYEGLPNPLSPKTIVLPMHLQLHMYYYHLLLTIFEPLVSTKTDQEPFPQHIVTDAKKHLHILVRLYYLRHGYEAMDLFIVIPLMLVASDCLEIIDDETPKTKLEALRSTLILVAKGLHTQRRNHYLAEALFRVIRGRMRPSELVLFKSITSTDEDKVDETLDMVQEVRSHWPVSVVKKKEDLDSYILTNLVETYAHLNVETATQEGSANE